MAENGHTIPAVVAGHSLKYVCIGIPDVPEYRQAFWGHLTLLQQAAQWDDSDLDRQLEAADYWTHLIYNMFLGVNDCMSGVEFRLTGCILEYRITALSAWISLGDVCGSDGSDGNDAAVPAVVINPVAGGNEVAFDMDGDAQFDDGSFIILNGSDGSNAATPIVSVDAVEGGTNVAFDMDADTFPEETVFIPDGNAAVTVSPAGFGATEKCYAAHYMAAQLVQTAKDAAYESIVNSNDAPAWWILYVGYFQAGSPFFDPAMAMLQYIEGLLDTYAVIEGMLNDAEPTISEQLYCDGSDLNRASFIVNATSEPISGVYTIEAKTLLIGVANTMPLETWNNLVASGLLSTTGDCSSMCQPAGNVLVYDFASIGAFVPIENRYPYNDAETDGVNTAVINVGLEVQEYGTGGQQIALSRLNVDSGDTWTEIKVEYETTVPDTLYIGYGSGAGDPSASANLNIGIDEAIFNVNWTGHSQYHFHTVRHTGTPKGTTITKITLTRN